MILKNKRKVLFLTGSRGEWGYIKPIISLIKKEKDLSYSLVVTNMHLLPNFGESIQEIDKDNVKIDYKINMALDGYTNSSMVKSLGVFLISFVDILQKISPSLVCIAGDRGEQLMTAIAGAHCNIPVCHIQAGEVSGNIDDSSRHAIARFSHIHFAANKDAAHRLVKSGEEKFRIFTTGAPQLDELHQNIAKKKLYKNKKDNCILFIQHSVTEEIGKAKFQILETIKALKALRKKTYCIMPNNDAGNFAIKEELEKINEPWFTKYNNLNREKFLKLLSKASCILGNSSCGIIEAPTYNLPCVNIGRRQNGRYQGKNVINCDHNSKQIIRAVKRACSKKFQKSLKKAKNPYGNGNSSQKIVNIFKSLIISKKILHKKITI